MALDQTAWTVMIHIVNFLSIGLMEGKGLAAAWRKLRVCRQPRYPRAVAAGVDPPFLSTRSEPSVRLTRQGCGAL